MTPTQAALDFAQSNVRKTDIAPVPHTGLFFAYFIGTAKNDHAPMTKKVFDALRRHTQVHGWPRPTRARMHADDAAELGPIDGIEILTDVVVARDTIYLERPE